MKNILMALALDSSRLHLRITVAGAEVIRLTGHSNAAARSSAVPKPTPGRLCKFRDDRFLGVYILIQKPFALQIVRAGHRGGFVICFLRSSDSIREIRAKSNIPISKGINSICTTPNAYQVIFLNIRVKFIICSKFIDVLIALF